MYSNDIGALFQPLGNPSFELETRHSHFDRWVNGGQHLSSLFTSVFAAPAQGLTQSMTVFESVSERGKPPFASARTVRDGFECTLVRRTFDRATSCTNSQALTDSFMNSVSLLVKQSFKVGLGGGVDEIIGVKIPL